MDKSHVSARRHGTRAGELSGRRANGDEMLVSIVGGEELDDQGCLLRVANKRADDGGGGSRLLVDERLRDGSLVDVDGRHADVLSARVRGVVVICAEVRGGVVVISAEVCAPACGAAVVGVPSATSAGRRREREIRPQSGEAGGA